MLLFKLGLSNRHQRPQIRNLKNRMQSDMELQEKGEMLCVDLSREGVTENWNNSFNFRSDMGDRHAGHFFT
jgi:hypothetical protein